MELAGVCDRCGQTIEDDAEADGFEPGPGYELCLGCVAELTGDLVGPGPVRPVRRVLPNGRRSRDRRPVKRTSTAS